MNIIRILNATKDAVAKFRTSGYPLRNVAQEIIDQRNLNSKERKLLFDTVFRFSREIHLFNEFLKDRVLFSKSMSAAQKDNLCLELFLNDTNEKLKGLFSDYQAWLEALKEMRFLKATGPLLEKYLIEQFKEKAFEVARGLFSKPIIYLAVDQAALKVSDVTEVLVNQGIDFFRHPLLPSAIGFKDYFDKEALPSHIKKHVFFMDAGSQIISSLVTPHKNQMVLDMCAGEGNKAVLINHSPSYYVASDISEKRLNRAKQRLKDKNVQFMVSDGRLLPYADNTFDWIILDAPCTGSGTIRRHPDLIHRLTLKDVKQYQKLQQELMAKASKLLKPNGVLVYATCSLLKEENQDQIEYVLSKVEGMQPLSLRGLNAGHLLASSINDYSFLLTPHINDCDGFYCATLSKK